MGWYPARGPDGKVMPGCLNFPVADAKVKGTVIMLFQKGTGGNNNAPVGRKRRRASQDARALVSQAKAMGWFNGKRLPKKGK